MPNLTSHQDFLMLPSALKSTNSFPNILPNGEATLFHYAQRNNSLDKMLDNDATFQQLKNKHHYGDSDNMNNNSLGLRSTSISLNDNKNNNLTLNGQNNTVKSIPVATVSGITSGQAKIEAAREAITSQGILNAHAFPTLLSTLLSSNPTQPTQPRSPSVPESATEHRSGLFSTREKENSADILSINMNSTASKNDSDSAGSPHSISDSNHSMASPSNSGDSANSVNYGDRGTSSTLTAAVETMKQPRDVVQIAELSLSIVHDVPNNWNKKMKI
uniref:ANK_REP_REGION domain-containing protein n=1 Tax=Rhabditophanes sp. KR3021 TaxID=114890 RepID=A0AC35U742_9BILA